MDDSFDLRSHFGGTIYLMVQFFLSHIWRQLFSTYKILLN